MTGRCLCRRRKSEREGRGKGEEENGRLMRRMTGVDGRGRRSRSRRWTIKRIRTKGRKRLWRSRNLPNGDAGRKVKSSPLPFHAPLLRQSSLLVVHTHSPPQLLPVPPLLLIRLSSPTTISRRRHRKANVVAVVVAHPHLDTPGPLLPSSSPPSHHELSPRSSPTRARLRSRCRSLSSRGW